MNYTISAAFVIDVPPEELEHRDSDDLHKDVLRHVTTFAALLRAKFPERKFRVVLSDMIVATPEYEVGEAEAGERHGDQ
jgi:hypothetical protein